MAKEVLYIPEEDLSVFIEILREGMCALDVPEHMAEWLTEWCNDEEAYIEGYLGS